MEISSATRVRITRAGAPEEKRKLPKYVMRKPLSSNRFQRLRSFLNNSGPRVNKPSAQRQTRGQEKRLKEKKARIAEPQSEQEDSSSSSIRDRGQGRGQPWTPADEEKLKNLVVHENCTNWVELATLMGLTKEEVVKRWRREVYRKIKLEDKVGGFLKYSNEEDIVLVSARKNGCSWEDIMEFLPGRSAYSIEARWRRVGRPDFDNLATKNRHFLMRDFLKKIIQKKRTQKEPLEEPTEPVG